MCCAHFTSVSSYVGKSIFNNLALYYNYVLKLAFLSLWLARFQLNLSSLLTYLILATVSFNVDNQKLFGIIEDFLLD